MKYSQYEALAEFYDGLNPDVDYCKWADFVEEIIKKYKQIETNTILDLACGTGSMTVELSTRGYEMIGVDLSTEMLMEAQDKAYDNGQSILFLNQDMCDIDLYGTVDACICCLDSVNYVTSESKLKKCFSLVNNFMNDKGLFIFDINTPYKFKNIYGNNAYILENENVLCAWQNTFNETTNICDFDLSFFVNQGKDSYKRIDESQKERMYTKEEITQLLEETSFDILGIFSDYSFTPNKDSDERWYFVCRAKNNNKQ